MEKEQSGEAKKNGARINGARPPAGPTTSETPVDESGAGVRYASDERFKEAHRKTSKVHAGLFRRLAE